MNENKKEMMSILSEMIEAYPNMRLGQIMENFVFGHHSDRACCIFYVEDMEALKRMREWKSQHK